MRVTDLRHFLDLPADTPTPARRLAGQLSNLVRAATAGDAGVAWETALQHHVPAERLARVYSYDMLGSLAAVPLAQLVVGPVSNAAGITATLLGCAAIPVLATAAMVASRSVRSVENAPAVQAVR